MRKALFFLFCLFFLNIFGFAQISQIDRFEIEKENHDDFVTVLSAKEKGLVIIRDTNIPFSFKNRVEGDTWEVTALDTALQEVWKHELEIDFDLILNGYEVNDDKVYLLFRDGLLARNNYFLITIDLLSGKKIEYNIENELGVELSHFIVVNEVLVLGGYIKNSPTIVSYQIGREKLVIIPGFFRDRSDILDLRDNDNGTFNVLTLEKAYNGSFIRLRTYYHDGTILFEKETEISDDYNILSGRSTGFVDGNFAVAGSYGGRSSYYSQGVFFAVVRPEGLADQLSFIDFTEMDHFFDYMRPKRAERIKRKIERKRERGKDYKYLSRILISDILVNSEGFTVAAEVYDPEFSRTAEPDFNQYGFNQYPYDQYLGNQYIRQPDPRFNVNRAQEFEFLEAIILSVNKKGSLQWDQSFTINEVETESLEPVVDLATNETIDMLYKSDEEIYFKTIVNPDSTMSGNMPLKLKYEGDEIDQDYEFLCGSKYWYGDIFFIWGNQKVENRENPAIDKRRNVLFINKVKFD